MNKQTLSLVIVALVALSLIGLQSRNTGMAQAYQHIMKDFDQTPEFNCLYYNILREIMRKQEPIALKKQIACQRAHHRTMERRVHPAIQARTPRLG